jgi:hypothetical protein
MINLSEMINFRPAVFAANFDGPISFISALAGSGYLDLARDLFLATSQWPAERVYSYFKSDNAYRDLIKSLRDRRRAPADKQ